MACFSRGLLLPGFRSGAASSSRFVLSEFSTARARFSTISPRLQQAAAKSLNKAPRPPASRKAALPTSPREASSPVAQSRYAFIKSLANKSTPTTLYEGPSHFWFYFGCWTSGLSILVWTATTAPTAVKQPEGVPQWVGVVFGASYVLLGSMGFYLIAKTPNIIHSIRFLPQVAGQAAKSGSATGAGARMEVTVKRMLPFLRPKVIVANLENVSLKSRLSLPEAYVPHLRRLERQQAEEARRKALWKFDKEHLLTMPFRRLGRAFVDLFQGVRAAWTDMGMGHVNVNGKQYKLDVTKGFAHDGFRTLERLVPIEP